MNHKLAPLYLARAQLITDAEVRDSVLAMLAGAIEEAKDAATDAREEGDDDTAAADDAFGGAVQNFLDDADAGTVAEVHRLISAPINVRAYFGAMLGECPTLVSDIEELPLLSACGEECGRAIDAAAVLLECTRRAYGELNADTIRHITASACNVFWRG